MKQLKYQKKIKKGIKELIERANKPLVEDFFLGIQKLQELALKIPQTEQEAYEKLFSKHMSHELNLLRIEYKKIEFHYKEVLFNTKKEIAKFERLLTDSSLTQDMRQFYQKEYLKVLEPLYFVEQMKANFEAFLKVLRHTMEEFNEWFFLGRIDFLKQLLQPLIIKDEKTSGKEVWLYKRYAKELQPERKQKMMKKVRAV